jgi:hypothetical protein
VREREREGGREGERAKARERETAIEIEIERKRRPEVRHNLLDGFFFFVVTLKPRVERHESLCAFNTRDGAAV